MPAWAKAGVAAMLGMLSFALVSAGSFAIGSRIDPTMKSLNRTRYILSGLVAAGGLYVAAKKSPIYGVAIAAGAVTSAIGVKVTTLLQEPLAPKKGVAGLGTVYDSDDGRSMGAAYAPPQIGMGAAYANPGQMGDVYNAAYYGG